MNEHLITTKECIELDAKYGQDLYFYLTMSDEEKKKDIVLWSLWMLADYISSYYYGKDKHLILTDIRRKYCDDKDTLLNDIIDKNGIYSSFYDNFSDYALNYYSSIEHSCYAPSWICYKKPKICKNRWTLYDITEPLECTGNIKTKYNGNYVVGYLSHDIDTLNYPIKDNYTYKLCRVNGVKAYNMNSKQFEVIFWRETAKDFMNVQYEDGQWKVFYGKCENVLYTCSKLSDIADWLKKEDNPYRDNILDFLKDKKRRQNLK